MSARSRTELERTGARLYPARSKRNQTSLAPATAAAEAFLRLQRSRSATGRAAAGQGQSVSPADRRNRERAEEREEVLAWVRTCAAAEEGVEGPVVGGHWDRRG